LEQDKGKFGLWSIVLLGINGTIGSGIFLLPGKAMELVGSASMLVYLFLAVLTMSIALCYAECSGMFSRNGAAYVYAREAFGEFIGFEVAFMKLIVSLTSLAAMTVAFVMALSVFWPGITTGSAKPVCTVLILTTLALVNIMGLRPTKILNNTVTLAKLFPLVLFVVVGAFYIHGENFTPFIPERFDLDAFGAAAMIIFFAFAGFDNLAVPAEDMKNPRRNLPIAISLVVVLCCIIYIAIQAVAIGTLGSALAGSKLPIADAAQVFMGSNGKLLVSLGTVISIGGILVARSFGIPRLAVALAHDRILPAFFAKNGRYGTPAAAIILCILIAIPIALSGSFVQLAALNAVSRFANYLPTCLAVVVLRHKRPELSTGFRVPYIKIAAFVAVTLILWLLTKAQAAQLLVGTGALLVGAVLFLFAKYSERRWLPQAEKQVGG